MASNPLRAYLDRNQLLLTLGFSSYPEYLRSSLWRSIRLKRLKKRCSLCPNPAAQLHHLSYSKEVLLGLDGSKLVSLCRVCHNLIEFDHEGRKRALAEANSLLRRFRNPYYRAVYQRKRKRRK